jgi:exodeoxyribonuclease III
VALRHDGGVLIVTYNLNGIKARLPRLLEYLDERKPDIVCLQELKSSDETVPARDIANAGYEAIWHGQKAFNGVAILSRIGTPVERRRGLPGEPEDEQSRYLEAEVGGVVVASIYLPNGNPQPGPKFDYKLRWFDRLNAHAASLLAEERPVCLAGDYNVVPTDADIWRANGLGDDALVQPEARAAFRCLGAQGWSDALKLRHPHKQLWTFWDYQMNAWAGDRGFRIDHLMLSPELADRCTDAGVDRDYRGREKASDHAPTWAEITA